MADSLHKQSLDLLAADIQATITLTGIFTDPVEVRRLDWEDVYKIGGVTVRYEDDYDESGPLSTNERDAIGYRLHVCVVTKKRITMTEEPAEATKIVQALRRRYNYRRRMATFTDTGSSEFTTRMSNGPRPPKSGEYGDKDLRVYTIHAWFLEPRDA